MSDKSVRRGQAWLAAELGVSQPRVSELINEPHWPFKRSDWSDQELDAIKSHVNDRRASNNATATDAGTGSGTAGTSEDAAIRDLSRNPEKVARIKNLIERTAKVKLEREMLAGHYIKKEDAERQLVQRIHSVKARLQEIPSRASLIAGKGEADCERILTEWMREICEYYANGGS